MPNAGRREKGPKCGSLPLNEGELAALVMTVSNLGLRGSCMYICTKNVCMWLNWLECAVGDWQHPGPFGQCVSAGGPHT